MLFEGTKAEQIKNDYDRDGYVRLPGFLSPDKLKELLTNLDRYVENVVPGLPNCKTVGDWQGGIAPGPKHRAGDHDDRDR